MTLGVHWAFTLTNYQAARTRQLAWFSEVFNTLNVDAYKTFLSDLSLLRFNHPRGP